MKRGTVHRTLSLCAALLFFAGLHSLEAQTSPRNILLILADDIGMDALSLFNTNRGTNVSFAPTPNIDRLAQHGITFRNCYGYPSCSPTRSAILTGRYGFRTGIGAALADPGDPILSPRDYTMAKALRANAQLGIRDAQIGKWHLSTNAPDPNTIGGWTHYSGFLAGELSSYYDWEKTVNGVTTLNHTTYTTSDNVSDAVQWIAAQGTNRWFLWFAPKSAHAPYERPPNHLHDQDGLALTPTNNSVRGLYYQAMIQALDTELGRLMTNVNLLDTMVVFLADNGTPHEVIQSPFTEYQAKGSLTEGGIRVPMVIAGAGVVSSNRSSGAVVHAVDLFATLLELAGVNLAATLPTNLVFDSRSFVPVIRNQPWDPAEKVILSENFGSIVPDELEGVAARGQVYKVVVLDNGQQEFYDLQADPIANTNLLGAPANPANLTAPQRAAYDGLTNKLAGWHNIPAQPTIARWRKQGPIMSVTLPEQVGIEYTLARVNTVESTNWTTLSIYSREIGATNAEVTLSGPAAAAAGFYRVRAVGR